MKTLNKKVHLLMPPDMVDRLKLAKQKTGIPVGEFVRRIVESALKELKL